MSPVALSRAEKGEEKEAAELRLGVSRRVGWEWKREAGGEEGVWTRGRLMREIVGDCRIIALLFYY